ncbi:GtrA family protein [Nocardioides sp. YIM 152315]|uniref:GtrA family protein n=1 Tax=Nocardioides sp. YIM 152315 TaxID=3031760 RepID=UPI0023DBB47B|nr:GtrA family protein [Nocardioides sp. YIM 152315]MDF1604299.1 GtrA family protein [Nocardioides sp. YIM 152315]
MPRELHRQLARFLVVGGINTLATYALFIVLATMMPAWLAYTLAYVLGLVWVVLGTSRFVFGAASRSRLLAFAAWYVMVYLVGRLVLHLLDPAGGRELLVATVVLMMATVPLSFLGGRILLHRPEPPRAPHRPRDAVIETPAARGRVDERR